MAEAKQLELPFGAWPHWQEPEEYKWVKMMHNKFGISYSGRPRHLEPEEKAFRIVCLEEEVSEYTDAETLEDELDALIDLLVFTVGTLERHGFPLRAPFKEVMQANCKKELAEKGENSKRGFAIDLVKPDGWTPPDIKQYIEGK